MILSGSIWVNITQENSPCNVGPWLTDNFYEGSNIYNIVPTSPLKNVGGVPTRAACLPGCFVHFFFFFWRESKFFRCGSKCFGLGQIFFDVGQIFFWSIWTALNRTVSYSKLVKDV